MRTTLRKFVRVAPAEAYLVAVVTVIGAFCYSLLLSRGVAGGGGSPYLNNCLLYLACLAVFACCEVVWVLASRKPNRPIAELRSYTVQQNHLVRLRGGALLLATLVVFMPLFSDMKSSIELFNPYSWDANLISADRMIFGTDAWRVLQPVIGFPIVTSAISLFYHVWILLIYAGSIFFAVYQRSPDLRFRYFTSFFAIWIICGVVLAVTFASVGPCFVGPILGMDTFDEQMRYLKQANDVYPVLVLDVQHELLQWFRVKAYGLGRGITAMPSMHVALAFLFFLATTKVSRNLGIVFGVFFVIILIGSVHLGYHYAVDGIVAIAVTGTIWVLSGRLIRSEWYKKVSGSSVLPGDTAKATESAPRWQGETAT